MPSILRRSYVLLFLLVTNITYYLSFTTISKQSYHKTNNDLFGWSPAVLVSDTPTSFEKDDPANKESSNTNNPNHAQQSNTDKMIDHQLPTLLPNDRGNYKSQTTMYGPHRAQQSLHKLPQWLHEYFTWHATQRRNDPTGNNTKYLVMTCLVGNKCGGTSDRLRPLGYFIYLAHLSKRVFIIKWNKPHDLSEFLMPASAVDWRAPSDIDSLIEHNVNIGQQKGLNPIMLSRPDCGYKTLTECTVTVAKKLLESDVKYHAVALAQNSYQQINTANSIFQSASYTDEMPCLHQWKYPDMFGDIFRVLFEPVPAIAAKINETMTSLGLIDKQYVSAHVRSRYPVGPVHKVSKEKDDKKHVDKHGGLDFFHAEVKNYLVNIGKNAIDCVTKLDESNLPIFFVSDSHEYTSFMSNKNNIQLPAPNNEDATVTIRGISRDEEPPHIDRDDGYPGSKPEEFYSVFEDLLIMGGSKCVAHGIGSFGSFGAGLTGNECRAVHRRYDGRTCDCPNDRADKNMCPLNATEVNA